MRVCTPSLYKFCIFFFQRDVFYNGGVNQDQNQKIQSEAPEKKII